MADQVDVDSETCSICGIQVSSTWYGKRGAARVCRSNNCKEQAGYATSRKRKRAAPAVDIPVPQSSASLGGWVLEVVQVNACLGVR